MLIKIGNNERLDHKNLVDPLEHYDSIISDQAEKAKLVRSPLSFRALRDLAESYKLHGIERVRVKLNDETVEIFFHRHEKKNRAEFNRFHLPFEAQAYGILSSLAASVRC